MLSLKRWAGIALHPLESTRGNEDGGMMNSDV